MTEFVLDKICSLFLTCASSVGWVSFVGKQVVQEIIVLWILCFQCVEVLFSCYRWRCWVTTLTLWDFEALCVQRWKLLFLLITLCFSIGFGLVESFSIFFSSLESSLEKFSSNALLLGLFLSILLHDLIVVIMSLLPIILPLSQQCSLLLSTFLVYLLQMLLLLTRFLLELFFFHFQLLCQLGHVLAIILLLCVSSALDLLHLITQQPSKFSLVIHFLLLGFLLF